MSDGGKLIKYGAATFYTNKNLKSTQFPPIKLEYKDRKIKRVNVGISDITFNVKDQVSCNEIICENSCGVDYVGEVSVVAVFEIWDDNKRIVLSEVPSSILMPVQKQDDPNPLTYLYELDQSFELENEKPGGYDALTVIVRLKDIQGTNGKNILMDNYIVSGNLVIFVNQKFVFNGWVKLKFYSFYHACVSIMFEILYCLKTKKNHSLANFEIEFKNRS